MEGVRYEACHPLRRSRFGTVNFSSHSWTEIANGSGTLEGTVILPRSGAAKQSVLSATTPDGSVIYRKSDAFGYTDGYIVVDREWDARTREIKITALELRTWMYSVLLPPKLDLSGDINYSWTDVDQLTIAEQIVAYAVAGGRYDGRPEIDWVTSYSGKTRDLNLQGMQFKTAGEAIDSMSRRSGGFEWSIVPVQDNVDGLPRWRYQPWFPERGSLLGGFVLRRTPNGGNFWLTQPPTMSSSDRRSRVWTTGSTETPQYAVDSDPGLAGSDVLLREKSTNYSSVVERTTLASHARSERLFYNESLTTLQARVEPDALPIMAYRASDRCRVLYRDDMLDLDLKAARIIQRKVSESAGAVTTVEVVIDVAEDLLPETDAGGTV